MVDWGLAKAAGLAEPISSNDGDQVRLKLSGTGFTPTQAGRVFGTPEYAPPEQVTGDLPNISQRSDVYGLGAILYCLMTGHPPFSRKNIDIGSLIRKVEAGDFPPPTQVRPGVAKALEAICLKAMARKPVDRYVSARALAVDVEYYLAEEPVSAYVEPWRIRARRWARKHRTLVSTATAAALVVALFGLGAISAVQTRARNDLAAKNKDLALQRTRAVDRETQAIEAVKRFRDAVASEPELKNTPALEALRKRLLKEPLAFFRELRDRLQADRDTRPESLARLARASFELGVLTHEIGDSQDSLIACRESQAIWQTLADADPTDAEFQRNLASSHNNIGNLLRATGRSAEAHGEYEAGLAIWKRVVVANPTVIQFQSHLASAYNNIGLLLKERGKRVDALKAYQSALATRQTLADANPTDAKLQADLVYSQYNMGMLLREASSPAEALKAYESALAIGQKLADANPTVTDCSSVDSPRNPPRHRYRIERDQEAGRGAEGL